MSSLSLPWPLGRGSKRGNQSKEEETEAASAELEEFGVTPQLLNLVEGFAVDTFRNFPFQDDAVVVGDGYSSSGINANKDLSEWQERHAILLLSKAKAYADAVRGLAGASRVCMGGTAGARRDWLQEQGVLRRGRWRRRVSIQSWSNGLKREDPPPRVRPTAIPLSARESVSVLATASSPLPATTRTRAIEPPLLAIAPAREPFIAASREPATAAAREPAPCVQPTPLHALDTHPMPARAARPATALVPRHARDPRLRPSADRTPSALLALGTSSTCSSLSYCLVGIV
ncbi:hypothetical protein AXF42_Ash018216 [Apostasia shenzhenica]|uniref:Uncharacterized protein n=1 Tax=Apostasia shenzhenica TaxID=1088818 RepID=A0A2I0B1D2_9ASPA|nr:hypothetical protein AXF42_Ash018216 [Apostasia shenzhenica]